MKQTWIEWQNRFLEKVKRIAIFSLSFCLLLQIATATLQAEVTLVTPAESKLTTLDGTELSSNEQLTLDQSMYLRFNYDPLVGIDPTEQYPIPSLPTNIKIMATGTDEGNSITAFSLSNEDGSALGTLRINRTTRAMTFQFDSSIEDGANMDNFYLKLLVKLDESAVSVGNQFDINLPQSGGDKNYNIQVIDTQKDGPTITKTGPITAADGTITGFDPLTNELTWTIVVTQPANQYSSLEIKDTYSDNQEYVAGSMTVNALAPAAGSVVDDAVNHTVTYLMTNITANQVTTIVYRTRMLNSAFLNANATPKKTGNIRFTNTAQAFLPGGIVALGDPKTAQYTHAITWLYKTSGNVINRVTGEMEWTITIYNNGLSMENVKLYDRLSPGIRIITGSASITINGVETALPNFTRTSPTDLYYLNNPASPYNVLASLGGVNNTAIVKYRTEIENPTDYDASSHMPPDSMYDNKAFITYQLSGGGGGGTYQSPIVEKNSAMDSGLLGKTGVEQKAKVGVDDAYHTITWTLTVNANNETLTGVSIEDTMTAGNTIVTNPNAHTVYEHVYEDLARNKPVFTYNGSAIPLTPYNATAPTTPYTYRMVTDATGKVTRLVFYLGDLNQSGTIVYRTTVTDPNIYAIQEATNKYAFENKAILTTTQGYAGFASAEVYYTSAVLDKGAGVNWSNKQTGAYDYDLNQFPWVLLLNTNRMEMKDICLTDVLEEGTSLIPGSVRVGGNVGYYDLTEIIPEKPEGSARPYYTYDETTRELKIYPEDITGSVVGTNNAIRKFSFFVQIDIEHERFVNQPFDSEAWNIHNQATVSTADHPEPVLSPERVEGGKGQLTEKKGVGFNNNGDYSIDYTVNLNRLHANLADGTQVIDTLPDGLELNSASVKLYHATITSAHGYGKENSVPENTGGTFNKGAEVDADLYEFTLTTDDNGVSTFALTLPLGSATNPYILEYSCAVTDISKAPFDNNVRITGYTNSNSSFRVESLTLTGASGGGTIVAARKTNIQIIKSDAVTGALLENAEFGLYYKGNMIDSGYTDVDGSLVFTNLLVGREYEIRELTPPNGYTLPTQSSKLLLLKKPQPLECSASPISRKQL